MASKNTRLLSLLLAVAMLFSLSPMAYAEKNADETEEISEIVEAEEPAAEETAEEEPTAKEETEPEPSAEPAAAAEDDEIAAEPEDTDEIAEAVEEEDEILPYGLPGMGKGFKLTASDLENKQALADNDVPAAFAGMTAGVDYVEDRLIFIAETEEYAQQVADAYDADLAAYYAGVAIISLRSITMEQAIELAADASINLPYVEPDYICYIEPVKYCSDDENTEIADEDIELDAVPIRESWESVAETLGSNTDPYIGNPTGSMYQWQHDMVDTYEAWGVTTGSSSVGVAVIDTGLFANDDINYEHRYASGSVSSENDENGHGTHVAGIIAAKLGNSTAGAGIAPDATIYSYRVSESNGAVPMSNVVSALETAGSNDEVYIISMSLGYCQYSKSLETAVQDAVNKGKTIVAAAGNDGTNIRKYPAAYNIAGLICVGAVDRTGSRASFSNYGDWVDVSAPGVDITSLGINGYEVDIMDGTSQATPIVAGACALYMSVYGRQNPVTMEKIIKSAVTKGNGKDIGKGIVNAAKLFEGDKTAPSIYIGGYKSGSVIPGDVSVLIDTDFHTAADSGSQFTSGDSRIIYTTNGKNPAILNGVVTSGTEYTDPIQLGMLAAAGKTITIKAAAVSGLGVMSRVASFKVKVGGSAVTPNSPALTLTSGNGATAAAPGKSITLKASKTVSTWLALTPTSSYPTTYDPDFSEYEFSTEATVSSKGVVRISSYASEGAQIRIVAYPKDGSSCAAFTITVAKPIKAIKLDKTGTQTLWSTNTRSTSLKWEYPDTLSVSASVVNVGPTYMPDIQWTSSNTKVAKVYSTGTDSATVEAVANGTATIRAKALDGSGKTASFKVKVVTPASGISITSKAQQGAYEYSLAAGKSVSHSYKIGDAYGKPSFTKPEWSYMITVEGAGELYEQYKDYDFSKFISLSNSGKLTVKSGISKYIFNEGDDYFNIYVSVTASVTNEGAGDVGILNSSAVRYRVSAPIKKISLKNGTQCINGTTYPANRRQTGDEEENDYETIIFNVDMKDINGNIVNGSFTVKSSNPKVCAAMGGLYYMSNSAYMNRIFVIPGTTKGTATITVTATDGTNAKASFKVKVT